MASLIEANTGAASAHADKEQRLLDVLGRFDGVAGLSGDAYFNADVDALKALLADDVVLHADHIATEQERRGPEEVARHFGKFFTNYKFKHLPCVRAACPATSSVFGLWDDEDVLMRPERFDEALPASGSITSVSGIWKLVMGEGGTIQDVFFMRQLTREEKKHRLKHRPSQLYSDFHAKQLVGPQLDLSETQIAKMHAAAEAFNEAWRTGNVGAVHDMLAPGCHTVNPVFGEKKSSREEFEEAVKDVFKYWEVRSNEVDIAVTPSSNKAFIHWHVRGLEKASQQENNMYGLNLLVFDPKQDMLVTDIVGFRQPLASEHDHIFKADSYQDRLSEQAPAAEASS